MAFLYSHDVNGSNNAKQTRYYIPTATAIEKGELVLFTPGTGIAVVAGTDFDDPFVGAAAAEHTANSGTEIFVYDSPTAVFSNIPRNLLTATGGSTTTFVVSGLLPQTNSLWVGGYLQIVSCAANSALNGKRIKITGSTGATGTLTFATQSSAFASGDTAYLCPGPLAISEFGWDLNSDGTEVDFTTSGGEALQLVDVEPENFKCYWKARLHQYGTYPKAL